MKLHKKNKMLLAGIILSLYLCYAFSFSSTIHWYKTYAELHELEKAGNIGQKQLKLLVAREKQLDKALQAFELPEGRSYQGALLKKISVLGERLNVKIVDFREPHYHRSSSLEQSSYFFTLEGSFNSMVQMINSIERDPSFGTVKHIKFEKKKEYRNNTFYLLADVIIQKNETLE